VFDEDFFLTVTEVERQTRKAFKSVVTKFLGNNKEPDCVTVVANMREKFQALGCLMSLKIIFFQLALGFFLQCSG
jgi:hypothetical protein